MAEPWSFGTYLKQRRKALDLTQAELARRLGCATVTLQKIELDERRPSRELAERLALILQLPASERTMFVQAARAERAPEQLPIDAQPPVCATRSGPGSLAYRPDLPQPLTPLIGRAQEVAAVCATLARTQVRLVTLTGVGGIGKTRLALQVAAALRDEFADGICLVELAPIGDPALVASTMAAALGVRESGEPGLLASLKSRLRTLHLLLAIDNFEQVAAAAPLVADLLRAAPRLKILATSRVPLRLSGEQEFLVPPLAVPEPQAPLRLDQLAAVDAVRLFVERAQAAKADFRLTHAHAVAVAEVCRRLDGLPLAIELAAARIKVLDPPAILERLGQSLRLLSGGPHDLPERQRTLRATIGWSYRLLDPAAQRLFARLAICMGGWTLAAAEAICRGPDEDGFDVVDGLQLLVDHHLVREGAGAAGAPRFSMLEPIREYALELLRADGTRSGEVQALRRRHAAYYLALAEEAEPQLAKPDQAAWGERLNAEHDNLRAALAWSQEPAGSVDTGVRLAAALHPFWWMRGLVEEGRAWLEAALAQPPAAAPSPARARALEGAAWFATVHGDSAAWRASIEECLTLYRALGDRSGEAWTLATMVVVAHAQGDYARAAALGDESLRLFGAVGERAGQAHVLGWIGAIARDQGNYRRAVALITESLAIYRERDDKAAIAAGLNGLGDAWRDQGEYGRAAALYQEALALAEHAGAHSTIALSKSNLGRVLDALGDGAQALALLEESVAWFRDAGHTWGTMLALHHLSAVVDGAGDDERATALLREGLGLQQRAGEPRQIAGSLERLAGLAARQGQPERAACLLGAAAALRAALGAPVPPSERAGYERAVALAQAQLDAARFTAGWAAGRAKTVAQAIAYALEQEPLSPAATNVRAAPWEPDVSATSDCAAKDPGLARLTKREREVLRLVAHGHSNRAIAQALAIDEGTVKRHLHSLLGKLEADSRTGAVARARVLGLL